MIYLFLGFLPAVVMLTSFILPLPPEQLQMIFYVGLGLGILCLGLGIVWIFEKKKFQGAMLVSICTIYVMAAIGLGLYNSAFPEINDVTTDLLNPPQFVQIAQEPEYRGRDLVYPERFKDTVKQHFAKLGSLTIAQNSEQFALRLVELIKQQKGWTLVAFHPDTKLIEVTTKDKWFNFQEDFVVRVGELGSAESIVDIRSRSRTLKDDNGSNFRRIVAIQSLIQEELGLAKKTTGASDSSK
jgi:uncharacterized protein (DUF1499 family)